MVISFTTISVSTIIRSILDYPEKKTIQPRFPVIARSEHGAAAFAMQRAVFETAGNR
jgi:hypothetical protein